MKGLSHIITIMKLRKQVQILKHTNTELETKLALQKKYNASNLGMIDRLRDENAELYRELKRKEHIEFFCIPKRCAYITDDFEPIFETSEPVITDGMKISVFDSLLAKGFIRKNREEDAFVIYEINLKTER